MSTMEKFDSILTKDLREVINTVKMSNFTKKRSAIWSGQSPTARPRSRAATAPSVQELSFISPKVTVKIPIVRDEVMDEIAKKPLTHVLTSSGKLKRAKSASGEKTLKTKVASRRELKRAKTMSKMPQPRDKREDKDYSITRAVDDNFWVVSNSTPTSAPCKTRPYVLNQLNEKVKYQTWDITADSVPREEKLLPLKHEVELENIYKTGQSTNWCMFNENLPENDRRNISSSFPGESFFDVQPQTRPKLDVYLRSNTDIRIGVNGETISKNKMTDSVLKKRPNSVETDEDEVSMEENSESSETRQQLNLSSEDVQIEESDNDSLDSFDILANDAKPSLVNPYAKEPRIRSSPFKTEVLPSDDDDDDVIDPVDDEMGELFVGCSPSLWITHKRSQSNENEPCEDKPPTTPVLSYSDELNEKSNKVIVANSIRPASAKKIAKTSQPIVFHKLVQPHTLGSHFVHLTSDGYKDHKSLTASDPNMKIQLKNRPITAFSKTWNHGNTINTNNGEKASVNELKKLSQGVPNHLISLTQLLKVPDSATLFQNVTEAKLEMKATKESKTNRGINDTRKGDQKRKDVLSTSIPTGCEAAIQHTSSGHNSLKSGKTPTISSTLPLTSLTLTNVGKHNSSLQPQQETVNRLSGSYRFSAPKNSPRSSLNSDLKHGHSAREDTRKPHHYHFRSFSQASFHSSPPSPFIREPRAKIVAMETELQQTKNLSHHTKRGFSANPLVNRRKLQRSASVGRGEAIENSNKSAEFLKITQSMKQGGRKEPDYNLTSAFEKQHINYPIEDMDQLTNLGSLKRGNVDELNQKQRQTHFNRRPGRQGRSLQPNFKLRGDSMILNLDKYIHLMYRDLGISSKKLSRPTSSASSKRPGKSAESSSTAGDESAMKEANEKLDDVEKKYNCQLRLESWKSYDPPIEGLRTSDLLRDSFNDADMSLESEHLLHSRGISLNKRKEKSPKNGTDSHSDKKKPVDDIVKQMTDNIMSSRGTHKEISAKARQKPSRVLTASAGSSSRQATRESLDQEDEIMMRGVTKVTVNISNKP